MNSPHKPDAAMVKAREIVDRYLIPYAWAKHDAKGILSYKGCHDMTEDIAAALREPPAPSEDVEALADAYYQTFLKETPTFYNARTRWMKEDFRAGYQAARQPKLPSRESWPTRAETIKAFLHRDREKVGQAPVNIVGWAYDYLAEGRQ